jgi:ankyrin repeat protein
MLKTLLEETNENGTPSNNVPNVTIDKKVVNNDNRDNDNDNRDKLEEEEISMEADSVESDEDITDSILLPPTSIVHQRIYPDLIFVGERDTNANTIPERIYIPSIQPPKTNPSEFDIPLKKNRSFFDVSGLLKLGSRTHKKSTVAKTDKNDPNLKSKDSGDEKVLKRKSSLPTPTSNVDNSNLFDVPLHDKTSHHVEFRDKPKENLNSKTIAIKKFFRKLNNGTCMGREDEVLESINEFRKNQSRDVSQYKRVLNRNTPNIVERANSILSASPSKRFIVPSATRTTSTIKVNAMNDFVRNGPRKSSDPEKLLKKEEEILGELGSSDSSGKNSKRRRKASSLKLMSPRGIHALAKSPLSKAQQRLKKKIESTSPTSDALNSRFYRYCLNGDYEKVLFMLDTESFACQRGDNSPRTFFVDVNFKYGEDGDSGLHAAARNNYDLLVDLLIMRGADPDIKDRHGRTPLHHACAKGALDSAIVLVAKGATPNIIDNDGYSPLFLSLKYHHFDLANDLLLFNADLNYKGSKGSTVIHNCMASGDVVILNFLLELPVQFRVLYNSRDGCGNTPLMKGVQAGHIEVVETLLKKRSDLTIAAVNIKGENLFHLCAQGANSKKMFEILVPLLISYPSMDRNKVQALLNERDRIKGYTPLHTSIIYENEEMLKVLCSNSKNYGIDINATDFAGNTPVHLAIIKQNKNPSAKYMNMVNELMAMRPTLKLNITNNSGVSVKSLYKTMSSLNDKAST